MSESRWSFNLICVVVVAALGWLVWHFLVPSRGHSPEVSYKANSANNLKQLALALHNYLAANRAFPAQAIRGADGKLLLSWRVALLPYLEDDGSAARLYTTFHLDEPWDSAHNRSLIDKMPEIFRFPGLPNTGETRYLAVVGPGTMFGADHGLAAQDVTDGLSNTIMVIEADFAIPRTQPDDLDYAPEHPMLGLGHAHKGGFSALLADGGVRFLEDTIDRNVLRGLMTGSGGENVVVP